MAEIISVICICIMICLAVIAVESISECKKLNIKKYEVYSKKLPASFDDFKLVVLADLHNMIDKGRDKEIIRIINDEKPDIIILAGDMIVCTREAEDKNLLTASFLDKLADIADCYYGYGNHERGFCEGVHGVSPDFFVRYMEKLSGEHRHALKLLDNDTVELVRNNEVIKITGLNMETEYYRRIVEKKLYKDVLDEKLGDRKKDDYVILIAHNPDYFETYEEWGADLVLSGHNHGGLVRFPCLGGVISPKLHIFPRYDYGKYEKKSTVMLVSGGMGAHSIKIRVNNVPEILSVKLRKNA